MYRWIKPEEERLHQYRTKRKAQDAASRETRETGVRHQIFFTHAWRELEPVLCWTVVLDLHWDATGRLVTKGA